MKGGMAAYWRPGSPRPSCPDAQNDSPRPWARAFQPSSDGAGAYRHQPASLSARPSRLSLRRRYFDIPPPARQAGRLIRTPPSRISRRSARRRLDRFNLTPPGLDSRRRSRAASAEIAASTSRSSGPDRSRAARPGCPAPSRPGSPLLDRAPLERHGVFCWCATTCRAAASARARQRVNVIPRSPAPAPRGFRATDPSTVAPGTHRGPGRPRQLARFCAEGLRPRPFRRVNAEASSAGSVRVSRLEDLAGALDAVAVRRPSPAQPATHQCSWAPASPEPPPNPGRACPLPCENASQTFKVAAYMIRLRRGYRRDQAPPLAGGDRRALSRRSPFDRTPTSIPAPPGGRNTVDVERFVHMSAGDDSQDPLPLQDRCNVRASAGRRGRGLCDPALVAGREHHPLPARAAAGELPRRRGRSTRTSIAASTA